MFVPSYGPCQREDDAWQTSVPRGSDFDCKNLRALESITVTMVLLIQAGGSQWNPIEDLHLGSRGLLFSIVSAAWDGHSCVFFVLLLRSSQIATAAAAIATKTTIQFIQFIQPASQLGPF